MNSSQLLLLLTMICGVTCLSLPILSRNPKGNHVRRFKIKITESGTTFNEEVKIDTKEKTETFHVPPHNNVDLSDIMHMFEMNLSIYRFPLKGVCYVAPLKKDQPPPKKLAHDMSQASQGIDDGSVMTEASTYRISGKVQDFQFWDLHVQSFCRGLDVYHVQSVDKNSLTIEPKDDHDKRERRQSNGVHKCPWKQSRIDCAIENVRRQCYIIGQSCAYYRRCYLEYDSNTGLYVTVCKLKHQLDDIICCKSWCV